MRREARGVGVGVGIEGGENREGEAERGREGGMEGRAVSGEQRKKRGREGGSEGWSKEPRAEDYGQKDNILEITGNSNVLISLMKN